MLHIQIKITTTSDQSVAGTSLHLTTHNTHSRQTFFPPAESEPAVPASKRTQRVVVIS